MLEWELNEPVVRALRARLEAELPAAIADLNARLPAGEQLPAPHAVLDYPVAPGEVLEFPTLGIVDRASDIEDDTGFSATGRHRLLVVVHHMHPEQRQLAWALRRYAQAVVRVALRDRALLLPDGTVAAGIVGFDTLIPGETLDREAEPQEWQSWTAVGVWARREEL